jgi:hypothetical protein
MDHISGNKGPMGSIEVPIERAYPDKAAVRVCKDSHSFYGRGWPSK